MNNHRGTIVDTNKDLIFAELLCLFICTKVNDNTYTFVCSHDVPKVIRYKQQIKKSTYSLRQCCSIVSSKIIEPSSSDSSYIQASPVAAMCFEGKDMFYGRVNQGDLKTLKEVVEKVYLSLELSSMNRDNATNSEVMFQNILLQLSEIYKKLLEKSRKNVALGAIADMLYRNSVVIVGQDNRDWSKLGDTLHETNNGWMKLFKVTQYFNVSLLFHDCNISFLIGDIMRLGNWSLSENFHLGLIENRSENGNEQNDSAYESSCKYYVDFFPVVTDVKHQINHVNSILMDDNLLGDLKRLAEMVCDPFSFSFNDQYLTVSFVV